MNADQLHHYRRKLAFETDAWDLHEALARNEPVIAVDGRSAAAYARERYATDGERSRTGTPIGCGC